MKKNYIAPSAEAYLMDRSDIITASAVVKSIGDGEFAIRGEGIFGN